MIFRKNNNPFRFKLTWNKRYLDKGDRRILFTGKIIIRGQTVLAVSVVVNADIRAINVEILYVRNDGKKMRYLSHVMKRIIGKYGDTFHIFVCVDRCQMESERGGMDRFLGLYEKFGFGWRFLETNDEDNSELYSGSNGHFVRILHINHTNKNTRYWLNNPTLHDTQSAHDTRRNRNRRNTTTQRNRNSTNRRRIIISNN